MSRRYKLAIAVALLLLAGCRSTEKDWDRATTANTVEGYKEFIQRYPADVRSADAKNKLAALLEESEWATASYQPSKDRLMAFMKKHPASTHIREARNALAGLNACHALDGGDLVITPGIGKLEYTGQGDALAGVVIECHSGTTPLNIPISSSGTYCISTKREKPYSWLYFQPIDIEGVTLLANGKKIELVKAFAGTIAGRLDSGRELYTASYGFVQRIGPVFDHGEKGEVLKSFFWPLVSSLHDLALSIPAGKAAKVAVVFPVKAEVLKQVFVDNTDTYWETHSKP